MLEEGRRKGGVWSGGCGGPELGALVIIATKSDCGGKVNVCCSGRDKQDKG